MRTTLRAHSGVGYEDDPAGSAEKAVGSTGETTTTKPTRVDMDADRPGPGGVGGRFGSEMGGVSGLGCRASVLAKLDTPNQGFTGGEK